MSIAFHPPQSHSATLPAKSLLRGARRFRFVALVVAVCLSTLGFGQTSFADVIGWDFTNGTAATPDIGTPTNYTVSAMTIGNSNGTVSTPVNSTSNSNGTNGTYSGASGGNNIGNAAFVGAFSSSSSYLSFTLTPTAGYGVVLTEFDFGVRCTSTGPKNYALYSSVDNFKNPAFSGSITADSVWRYLTNGGFAYYGPVGTAVTFRLYTYGGSGNASAGTENIRLDDISMTSAASNTTTPILLSASASPTSVAPGQSVQFNATVTPGGFPASTGIAVTADLSSIGGSSSQAFTAGANNTFTCTATIPSNQAFGNITIPCTVTDAQGRTTTVSANMLVAGNLTIFHTNDTHARVVPHKWIVPQHNSTPTHQFETVGGAAYLGGKMLSLVTAKPDALVLDGGDISEGDPVGDWNGPGNPTGTYGNGTSVGWYQILDTKLKAIPGRAGRGLDAMVVGNHDIRDISYLNNLKNQTNFPVISINICAKGTKTPYFQPYVILNVDGHKIGVIGYTTESSDSPEAAVNNTIDVVRCDWSSSDATKIHFSSIVSDLRNNQGCDMVILLTHDGHSDLCTSSSGSTPILVDDGTTKLPEIAVTGHWHTWCQTVWQPEILNYKTIFTEADSFMHYIGELDVDPAGKYQSNATYVLRNSEITPDPDIASYIQTRKDQFAQATPPPTYLPDQIIGYSSDDLLLDNYMKWWSSDEYPWSGNNTAGNWICDGILWKAQQLFGQVDLSIESGGGVRADIPAGPITYTQIYETYPWADDTIYVVNMTGQEIYNYVQGHGCDVGLSRSWFVDAFDGNPTTITYNGQPIVLTQTYKVAITNYMYMHDTVPFSDQHPQTSTYLARTGLVEYTATFPQGSPYNAGPSRYNLNTDFSGGYRAVVLMMNDADSSTTFDDAFIRLLNANSETMGHLGTPQVPTTLVNSDSSINRNNRLSEIEMYRSYLGFKTGMLHPGDIIETYGKGSFYGGDPEFVDQEGIQSNGVELNIIGHDPSLAQPSYFSSINGFFNQTYKNHYVKFVARKTGTAQVQDQSGTTISVEDVTAYSAKTLPGNVGDLLVLTGIPTSESFALRFRCDSAVLASTQGITNYPPDSQISAVPNAQTASLLTLTATANIAPGAGSNVYTLSAVADSQISSGSPTTNYNTKTYLYTQSSSTDSFGNERAWLRFDLSSLPAGVTIASAKLNMYCWKAQGASAPTAVCGGTTNDTWDENAITWNTQPSFGAALDTQTLASGTTNTWYTWDVTSFAQSQISGDKLVSLAVKPATENSTDATPPAYAFESREYSSNTPYLQVTVPSGGTVPTITQVQFYYRYSVDDSNWSPWTLFQTVSSAPWTATFNYPNGFGYYEFYSQATDSNGQQEPAPAFADTAVHYTAGPALVAQEPVGTTLTNSSSTVDFGSNVLNNTSTRTFTLQNNGTTDLTSVGVTIDGTNSGDFSVTTAPASTISAGGSSTFVVTFSPTQNNGRSAALHVASNDPNANPFTVNLTGTGYSITDPATNVSANGATLQGDYNPNGVDTTVYFMYGTTPSYGSSTAVQDLGSGSSDVPFSAGLAGLQPGTTYYVVAVITSGGTTTYGAPQTFTTPAAAVPAMPHWAFVALASLVLIVTGQHLARKRAAATVGR